ncbi:hypothetical protein BDY21DRAFT_362683 [Lineolata rhizophorae]|uniref:Uncharacterized protein n=1 Tax=Lineolata rhizophorae TaxID=578093 RepID=A0A6A6P5C5_9PEZI|nr:hypothetical protein BDY21DRAFT_362683 [Lineolata rhizophorae]
MALPLDEDACYRQGNGQPPRTYMSVSMKNGRIVVRRGSADTLPHRRRVRLSSEQNEEEQQQATSEHEQNQSTSWERESYTQYWLSQQTEETRQRSSSEHGKQSERPSSHVCSVESQAVTSSQQAAELVTEGISSSHDQQMHRRSVSQPEKQTQPPCQTHTRSASS